MKHFVLFAERIKAVSAVFFPKSGYYKRGRQLALRHHSPNIKYVRYTIVQIGAFAMQYLFIS